MSRIAARFAALKTQNRKGLVTFVTAGDPDLPTFQKILNGLPTAGADVVEIGVPFSDPMADGPSIQLSSQRALKHNISLADIFSAVVAFRKADQDTPIVLMGYFNPIYRYGCANFARDAAAAGADGMIVVDLPPEEADELLPHLKAHNLNFIFLTAPTSSDQRLPAIVSKASGFIYHVAVMGVTGTKAAEADIVKADVTRLRRHTQLPIAVGFGIKTAAQVNAISRQADAAVVGSAIVDVIAAASQKHGAAADKIAADVHRFVADLATGVR
jgi:tryptophan synthase alpha chain